MKLVFFFLLILNLSTLACKRNKVSPIIQEDLDRVLFVKFNKVSDYFSYEEAETVNGVKIRLEQDGCNEYIERYTFYLPFGMTAPQDGNMLLKKSIEILQNIPFTKDYKFPIKKLTSTLDKKSNDKTPYNIGDNIKLGKESVDIDIQKHGKKDRKIVINRKISI